MVTDENENKYQKALETIKNHFDVWTGSSIWFMYENEINLLQELINEKKNKDYKSKKGENE